MKKNAIAVLALITALVAGAGAFAHSGATGIYKERMDAMMDMGKVIKSISSMMRGETAYDAQVVKEGARTLKSHAGSAMTSLFPEGTTKAPSEARAEIWSDWETFEALARQLETFASGLELAAENGLAMAGSAQSGMTGGNNSMMMGTQNGMMGGQSGMMGGQGGLMAGGADMMSADALSQMPVDGVFNMVAQTCSSCHTQFRQEKN